MHEEALTVGQAQHLVELRIRASGLLVGVLRLHHLHCNAQGCEHQERLTRAHYAAMKSTYNEFK